MVGGVIKKAHEVFHIITRAPSLGYAGVECEHEHTTRSSLRVAFIHSFRTFDWSQLALVAACQRLAIAAATRIDTRLAGPQVAEAACCRP
jgi:hypothetical protein